MFQETGVIERGRDSPYLSAYLTTRPLTLLDLTDVWLARVRASLGVVFHARSLSRAWSRAIYDALPHVDGLLYRSTLTGRYCAALYERAQTSMPATPELDVALDDPRLTVYLARAAVELDYVME